MTFSDTELGTDVWPRLKAFILKRNKTASKQVLFIRNYCKQSIKIDKMPPRCVLNPLHPNFPAERLAFSGRKNRVRLGGTPLRLRSLPGEQAWWGGRWMISGRDGAANDIHKWPHPPKC